MNKKLIVILLVFVGVMCFCCLCCFSIFFVAGQAADKEIGSVSEEVLYPLCMEDGDLSLTNYNRYFDDTEMTLYEAESNLNLAFGNYDDCGDFKGQNIFRRLMNGHSFEISTTTTDGTEATYSFKNNDLLYTFYLSKDSGEWLITDID